MVYTLHVASRGALATAGILAAIAGYYTARFPKWEPSGVLLTGFFAFIAALAVCGVLGLLH